MRVAQYKEASEVSLLPDDWNHSEFWVVEMSRTEATAGLAWRRQLSISSGMKIFLSHKSTDKDAVTDFQKTLRHLGYDPWLDEDAMPAGRPRNVDSYRECRNRAPQFFSSRRHSRMMATWQQR